MSELILATWLKRDSWRMECLEQASRLKLAHWYLAAGFLRNLAWDQLHSYSRSTPLQDVALIYFDPHSTEEQRDQELESKLSSLFPKIPWSVKNQARMHLRNSHKPYEGIAHSMSFWPETATAVGVSLQGNSVKFESAYGFDDLFQLRIRKSPGSTLNQDWILRRIETKNWLKIWPLLRVDIPKS